MEGARIEAGIRIEALERAKAIHELERVDKSPANIEAGRAALREQQGHLLTENKYYYDKKTMSHLATGAGPADSRDYQEMIDKGWVLYSDFYELPAEQQNNVYAAAAKDPEKAVSLAQHYLKLAEDEHYQEIYDWVNKDSGWQFGRRALGMVGGAALKLASGLDPYGSTGQSASKTGNALISGGAASAARNGLFGIEALGGDESGISSDVPFIGRGQAGITYQVGASVLQSAAIAAPAMLLGNYSEAAAKVAEVLGTTLMGSSAAADDYTQCIQNGMTVHQARMHATAAGIAEAAFEYISLDKLVDPDLTTSALKRWLQQAGIEASEEVVTSIANRISDELLADHYGIESAVERRTRELMAEGLAYNAARGKAENEWLAEITQDGMSGFLSGLIMGGGSEIMRGVETFHLNRANRNTQTPTTILQQEAATDSAELSGGTEQATVGVGSVQQNADKAQNQQSTEMEQGRSDAQYMEPDELDSAIEYWSGLLESARGENNQEIVNRYAGYVAGLTQVQQERADLNQRRLEAGDDLGLAEGLGRVGVEQVNQRQAVTGSQADYGGQRMPATAEQNGGMNNERIQGGSQIGGDSGQIARAADDGQLAARAAGPADSGQRDAGLGSDRQAGGLGEGTGRSVAGGAAAQELYQLRNQVRALEAERRSAAQIGVAYGTKNESLRVVPEELYTSAMRAEQARAEENGVRLTFVTGGAIEIRGKGGRTLKADGLHQVDADGTSHIFARADSKRFTPEQLTRHEDFHDIVANNRGLLLDMVEALYETQGEEGVARLVDAYVTALDGCYGVYTEGMIEDDQRALAMLYLEEIFADQYAGMNRSSGEARRAAELAGGVAQRFAGDIENARQNRAGIDRRNGPGTRLSAEEKEDQRHILTKLREAIHDNSDMDVVATVSENAFARDPNKTEDETSPLHSRPTEAGGDESSSINSIRDNNPDVKTEDQGIDWNGNREQRLSVSEEDDGIDLTRYSGKDRVYMEAVKNGNTDEAAWMVEDAAKRAGFSHKGFHQTGADFTSFSTKNEVAGQFDDETPTGIFIKPTDEDIGLQSGTKQMPLYFKADNMLEFANREEIRKYWIENVQGYRELDAQLQARNRELEQQYDELDAEWNRVYQETYDSDDQSALDDVDRRQDEFLERWNRELQPLRRQMKNLVTEYMKGTDYDGIHLKYDGKVYGGPRVETYIVFNPEQTKSAEPIVRDDSGNVIPPSERFRTDRTGDEEWKNNDIRFSPSEADDDSLGVDWIGSREEGETKTQAVTETDAPHPSPAATPSPEGEGSETGGQAARVTENAQAMAREKKVSIAEKASIEGLKSRIESAEKRLGAYQILQQEGMMTDEIRAQMRDVQESLEIFRNALDEKKAKRKAAKEAEKNNKELRAQRKQARAAEKKALAKEAELQADKPRQARKEFRQDALNLFSVPAAKRQTLGNLLNKFADTVTEKGSVSEADRRELFRQLYEAGVEVAQPEDYYKDIRDFVKSGRVYVPEDVRAEFGDDWDAFRKRAWGNGIYLTNDQNDRGADVWNAELAEVFPGSFDASETDARNMLENIVDLAEEGKTEFVSIEEMMRRNQDQYGVTVDQQMDELEQKVDHLIDTFAQKAELEQKVKKAGVMQLVKERQKNREIAAQQTQRKRENETRSQVMKQLQQLNKMRKKSAPEIQKQIDSIIGNLDTMARSISPAGLEDLQALSRKYMEAAEDPNFLGNPYVEARLARLNQVQLDDLEISDVIELGRTISALVKTVTDDRKLLTDARNKEVSEAASMAAKEIQSSEGSKGGKLRDFLGNEHLSPTREIQRLGGWVRGGQMEQLSRSLEDGGTRRMEYQRQATRIFDKFLADKANQKWMQTAQGKDAQWIKLTVPAGITGKDGALKIENVSFEITPMMRVGLLMHSRNVDNLRHIETGGIVIPNKEYYRKGDLANADAKGTRVKLRPETVRAIVRECTAQERAFAGLLEQYYDGLSKEKINEVSMQIDGFERAGGDHYYGIKVSRKFLAAQPEQIQRNLALDSIGSIVNERVHAGNPIILEDASKALEDHIDLISKYYGYTAAIRDFNAVMNYTFHGSAKDGGTANAYAGSVKEILQDKWGSGAQKYLDKLLGDLQQSSGINETAAQFLAKIRGNLAGASLMFNPAVAVSQTASLPGAMQTLGMDGIVAALKPEKVDMGLIEKYSPVLQYRNQGNSTQELGDYMKEQGLEGKLPFFFNWIQKMDSWTIRRLWVGAEYRVSKDTDLSPGSKAEIDAGTDPYYQEVARVFQRAVYDTQPNYSEMQRPAILRSESDLTKMLTMYKTVPLQYYNMMYEAVGRLRADKARYKQNASAENKANYEQSKSFAAKTFVGVLSANVVYVVMKALIKGTIGGKKKKYLDDEGDLDAGKIFGGLGKDLIETYAGSIIGGSDLLTSVEKLFDAATTGSYSRYGGTEISALSAIEDTLGGLYNLAKEIHDQDLTGGLGAVKELAKQLAMDTGIPANNIETYLLGTMKWIAPEWVDRYENFFDEFERADLKGEHGRDLRAAIRVLMDNRTDGLKDETIDEIMRLWENGQNAAIPSAIPSKVSIDGEDVEIKGADRSAFRERWGQVIGESLEKLLASDAYEAADDKGKAKLIAKLYEYARQQAAAAVTERKLDAWVEFGKACEAAGIPLTDYLTVASVDKGKLKDMDGEALDSAIRSRMEFRVGDLDKKTLDELGRLFANGASGAIPSDVPTSVSVSGEERTLTPEERVAWLQAWKRIAGEGLEGLISSGAYKTADDAGKAKMLSALYDMARASASSEVVNGYAPDKWVSVGMEAAERGVPIDEYASFHVGMSGLKTAEKLALLKGQSWSDNQKEFIWTELMATDTQYSKYQNLKNAGMKWADAMEQLGIGAASTTPSGLTDAQQAQYDKYWNEISGPATQQLLNNADYKKADKAGQAAFLDRLNDYAARVAKAKVLSGYDKGKWVECGERLTASGVKLDEYIVYCTETSDANNRAKYSALAKTGWTDAQKLTALEYISTPTYSAGKVGRDYQIPVQRYLEGLTKADADESGNINQGEAEAWLDRSGLDWESKAYLWQMLCYSSKWKNNPYSTTLGEDIWHSLHPDG